MPPMLEALDEVTWAKYDHAYGPADDIPDLLRALTSDNREARARAQYELYGTLWHQGSVYEATQHVVPFLVALLESSKPVDRPWLLVFLAALANGNSHHEVHQDLVLYDQERETDQFRAKIVRELEYVAQCHASVRHGVPVYRDLLTHDDAATRASAAYLLGLLQQDAPATIPLLRKRLDVEPDSVARASLAEALASLADEPLTRHRLQKLTEHDPDSYVRWASARSLAFLAGPDAPSSVVNVMLDALRNPDPALEEDHAQSPWAEENTPAASARALLIVGPAKAASAVGVLVDILPHSDPSSALALAECLLGVVFADAGADGPRRFEQLSAVQQEVVRALAYSDTAWAMGASMGAMLERHKLPRYSDELQAFAGLAPRKVGGDSTRFGGPGESMAGAPIPDEW